MVLETTVSPTDRCAAASLDLSAFGRDRSIQWSPHKGGGTTVSNAEQPPQGNLVFVDQIGFGTIPALLRYGRSARSIVHFEPLSRSGRSAIRLLRTLRVLRADVEKLPYNTAHIRGSDGRNLYPMILRDARAVSASLRPQLLHHPVLRAMDRVWPGEIVALHLERLAEEELSLEFLRIGMAEWFWRTKMPGDAAKPVLLIQRRHHFSRIREYASSRGVDVAGYPGFAMPIAVLRAGRKLSRAVLRRRWQTSGSATSERGPAQSATPVAKIGMRYWFRTLSLDPADRSEFFWIHSSDIPSSALVVYQYSAEAALDQGTQATLASRGIVVFGNEAGTRRWRPSRSGVRILTRTLTSLVLGWLGSLVRGRFDLYPLMTLAALGLDHAYWYDFYAANRVLVNVSTPYGSTCGQVLALRALGAVAVAYQYSASNFVPTSALTCGEDVQFVFSPLYEELWRNSGTPTRRILPIGYVYDGVSGSAQRRGAAASVRAGLEARGARFIICFFDENSVDRWSLPASHEDAADDYEQLLAWLLDDPTLGLIVKPKMGANLFARVRRVQSLIDRAQATGRCVFLMSGKGTGDIYPSEAAAMADLCIGHLGGRTAALEARLAGVPTLLIDRVGLHDHPFYAWGRETVVFEDFDTLREAVTRYRRDPAASSTVGDWSAGIDDLDPFRDGKATHRMATYIGRLFEALRSGASREEALALADGSLRTSIRPGPGTGEASIPRRYGHHVAELTVGSGRDLRET